MTESEAQEIARIEKERRRREAALLILLLLLIDQARRLAGASIRMGLDPVLPIRQVIIGDPSLHLPGLTGPLASAMADSYLTGYRRAHLMADLPAEPLSAEATMAQYIPWARAIADGVVDSLSAIIRQSMIDGRAAQLRTGQMAREALRALTRYGWTRFSPQSVNPDSTGSPGYSASGVATDAVLKSYADGIFNGYNAPPVKSLLTAFRHRSVIDKATSQYCDEDSGRNGLTLPPDHPYWRTNWTPLHRRCRSVVLGVFKSVEYSTALPTIPPAAGWGGAPTSAFGYRFGNAA